MPIDLGPNLAAGSPEWWLRRLLLRIHARRLEIQRVERFYDGNQPWVFASDQFQKAFGSRFPNLPANLMPAIVEAEGARLIVQGFRFGEDPRWDKGVWRIWQENQLDAESMIAHEIALVKTVAYTLVAPPPRGSDVPVVTVEDPTEAIVEMAAGSRRVRAAGLKVWEDDDDHLMAVLYLPSAIYRYRSTKPVHEAVPNWASVSMTQDATQPVGSFEELEGDTRNPLGVVPLVPLVNRPRRDGTGKSEVRLAMGNQLAINKYRIDALVASDYTAFPQRWAVNVDIDVDEDTGRDVAPFKAGVDNLWASRKPTPEEMAVYADKWPEAKFGQFPAGDPTFYINMIKSELISMSSITATPYYYLLGEPTSVPPSGESRKSSEAPLVTKVSRQAVHFGEGWEETMRLALKAAGQADKAATTAETDWASFETRDEAARTQSILAQHAAGLLPDEFALEELGYSNTEIERIKEIREQERLEEPTPIPTAPSVVPPPEGEPEVTAVA